MNFPKMLYKSESVYTDSEQIKTDLTDKKLKTIIVTDQESEEMRRKQGYVDLHELMSKPKLGLPKHVSQHAT